MARKWDKPSGDTLFAYWEANPYVITLVSEGSGITSQGTTSVTTYYDRHLPPGAMPPEKTGYVFKGYFTERNGAGIQYYNGTTPMTSMRVWATNGNAVLYAHFVNETVNRIDFDKQGGAGGTNYLWIKYQDPMPNAQAPTKTGYNFTGYYDAASGGVQYYDGSMQAGGLWDKPAASTILYARWQPAVYTITLKQCNVAAAVTIAATYDAMLPTISAAAPQRTGYTFDGYWNDSIGGTKFYNADRTAAITPNKWTIDSNYVLYAHWIPVQKTITINAAESTIPSQTLTVAYDQPYPAMTNIPVLNGYELMGFWNTQNPTGGVQYYRADGTPLFEKYTINGNLQLYARWRYSVVYLANGGSGVIADTTMCIKGIAQQLHGGSGVMRTGYTLSGWALLPNASAKEWSLSESVSAMRSLAPNYAPTMRTLYAVWTAGGTIITFDRQQGTDGTERTSALYQNQIPDIVPPVRTGYDFAGYYSGANGTGTQYYAANGAGIGLWTMTDQTKTLYAKWTPASFMVILDKQNGIAPDTISVIYNSPMPAGIAAPTYAQHTFAGYWDVPVSYGAMYYTEAMAGNQPFNKTTNTTLYARWIAHESTILLYPEGGSGGDQSVRVEYGQPMPSGLTPPSRDGYIFDGYWAYYPSTIQFYDANMNSTSNWNGCCSELYAKWIPQRYNIAYRCNYSGCNTDSMRSVLYNSYISKHPRIERAGFSLRGWSLNPNTDPSDYDAMKYDGWFYEYPADTTLYAVWDTGAFWVDFYLACNTAKTTDVPNMQIFLYSKRIDFLPTTAHCYGHNFEGWYYPDANGRRYQAGDTYDMSQNASFVAKWSAAQPYTMTLIASPVGHVNGADSAGIVVYKNSRVEALPAARCDTAIFDGWYDLPQNALTDGTQSRKWSDTTIYPYERSHIAYAHWLPMEDAGRVDVIPPIQIIVDSSTRVSQRYYITNDCDAKSADVHFLLPPDVKLYYNGDSARDIKLPLPTPDIYVLRYTLKLGYTSVNDSIVIERRLNPQKIIVQKRGILIVNDNYEQNGGYKFSAYQWYRDTMPIAGATHQYFYEGMDSGAAGALRHDVKYSVLLTTIAGKRHFTCPEYARTGAVKQMSVYPNPAEQGAYINIALPSDENIARIEIFSLSGALIRTHETTPAAVQQFMVDMPPGLYIIKAGSSTSTMTVK
jgi:uncharacterized repeat protein (TIGR02543 family)